MVSLIWPNETIVVKDHGARTWLCSLGSLRNKRVSCERSLHIVHCDSVDHTHMGEGDQRPLGRGLACEMKVVSLLSWVRNASKNTAACFSHGRLMVVLFMEIKKVGHLCSKFLTRCRDEMSMEFMEREPRGAWHLHVTRELLSAGNSYAA